MDFRHSDRSLQLQDQVRAFLDEHVYPAEHTFEEQVVANRAAGEPFRTPEVLTGLKDVARSQGLWNLFLPDERYGAGLSVLDYAPIAELSGRSVALAPGSDELCGAGHRQHGAARDVRDARAGRAVAHAPAERRDPLVLLDDRAGGRVIGRHEHRVHDHARRRRTT